MLKLIFFIFSFSCITSEIFAQVQGLSASKLATVDANTVPKRTLEFEPSLSVFWSTRYWNASREKLPSFPGNDSVKVFTEFGFRSTYGINDKMEFGTYMPNDLSYLDLGTKIKLLDHESTGIALLAGSRIKIGNAVMLKSGHDYKNLDNFSLGLAGSFNRTKRFSVDVNSQFSQYISAEKYSHKYDYFLNTDFGYYVHEGIQMVAGLNYALNRFDTASLNHDHLFLNLGITIETAKNLIIVVNSPLCLVGKNEDCLLGFAYALTITID